MHNPKVSICVPTYNRAAILPYAVESVLSQTYPDFELLICDDASPDNTADIVAIDANTWRLITKWDAFAEKLRVVARTKPTPAMPYI